MRNPENSQLQLPHCCWHRSHSGNQLDCRLTLQVIDHMNIRDCRLMLQMIVHMNIRDCGLMLQVIVHMNVRC